MGQMGYSVLTARLLCLVEGQNGRQVEEGEDGEGRSPAMRSFR